MVSSVLVSYIIFHTVIKDTYTNHFMDEMLKSELVLDNYLDSRYTLLESGIDILLSDPRFLASIAEGDPSTAQNEISDFKELVQTDFLVVTDTSGVVIAKAGEVNIEKWELESLKPNKYQRGYNEYYSILNNSIYQVLSTPIHFFNRFTIGKLIAGYKIDHSLIHKFNQLSGANIVLLGNQKVVVQSNSNISLSIEAISFILKNSGKSKSFWSSWDHPYYKELSAWSSYIDLKYKFATHWYTATRLELMRFSNLKYKNYNDS